MQSFLDFLRPGRPDDPLIVAPKPEVSNYAKRRLWLSDAFAGETVVIPSGNVKVRANDTHFPFRPGSDFVYLTGDRDPDSVLVLWPTVLGHDAVLYSARSALVQKSVELGIETAPLEKLTLANGRIRILRGLDQAVESTVGPPGSGDRALASFVSELKLVKDDWEIAELQQAADATVRGFEDVARVLPGGERLLEGVFGLRARCDGNDVGYRPIIGGGPDLLLMDMGVEGENFYTADVARTVPLSGTFTTSQRRVYDIVYAAQRAGLDVIRPGVKFQEVRQTCLRVLAEGLRELGVPASDERSGSAGHMLGIDVHDCANARPEYYQDGALSMGYVLTVEAGLYFRPDDELVPEALRGIGVRIEDDVLVTADGWRNLSAGLPRTADQVEAWLAAQRDAGPRLPGRPI